MGGERVLRSAAETATLTVGSLAWTAGESAVTVDRAMHALGKLGAPL